MEHTHFRQIAEAISFLQTHFLRQPSLEETAAHVHMSPFHFQRVFSEWAGVSPKKFVQYLSVEYAKKQLAASRQTLADVAAGTGLSGTGRLHDLFVTIEAMTPGDFGRGADGLHIQYSLAPTPFGEALLASTHRGLCYLAFTSEASDPLLPLQQRFPKASLQPGSDNHQQQALNCLAQSWTTPNELRLHLSGTPFQLKVWEALLKIPMGTLSTYGRIAESLAQPGASRAVGTAVGRNPVAFLIPCHRVIQASGVLGGYMWGPARKAALLGWEAAITERAL